MNENTGNDVYEAHDWIGLGGLEQWYGSRSEEETLDELLVDTDNKLRQWFFDYDYIELPNGSHERTDGDNTVVVIGLLNYWREKVEEYRRGKNEET